MKKTRFRNGNVDIDSESDFSSVSSETHDSPNKIFGVIESPVRDIEWLKKKNKKDAMKPEFQI